jgi:hypothetical protein
MRTISSAGGSTLANDLECSTKMIASRCYINIMVVLSLAGSNIVNLGEGITTIWA